MKTCAECPHLRVERVINTVFAYCQKTENVVPQVVHPGVDTDQAKIYLTRIPSSCPLAGEDGRVTNGKPLPRTQWQAIHHQEGSKK